MYYFFVGCDISKAKIDVSIKQKDQLSYVGEFSNNHTGFKQLVGQLNKLTSISEQAWLFCFENTGSYSKPLLEWLFSQGLSCVEECPIKIKNSLGLKRGKDDKADSKAICQYAYEKRDIISPTKPSSPLILKLKVLIARRSFLVKSKTAISNSLHDASLTIDQELHSELIEKNERLLKELNEQIADVGSKINSLMTNSQEIKKNAELVQSVIGIGPVITAKMIAVTHNFRDFANGRKFACYSGIAPFPNRSGTRYGRNKISHMANKEVKSLLSMSVRSAILHDPDIAKYYNRKIEEGKPKGVVYNAIKNKIVQRIFSVVKRQTPYVKIMNYAS